LDQKGGKGKGGVESIEQTPELKRPERGYPGKDLLGGKTFLGKEGQPQTTTAGVGERKKNLKELVRVSRSEHQRAPDT